jgi:hypothetical protein
MSSALTHASDACAAGRYPRRMRLALVAFVLVGCAATAEEVRADFEAYVAGANACAVDADCAIASGDCPVGCWVVVRVDRVDDVERRAQELVSDYERGGARCEYDCVPPGDPICDGGRCASTPTP